MNEEKQEFILISRRITQPHKFVHCYFFNKKTHTTNCMRAIAKKGAHRKLKMNRGEEKKKNGSDACVFSINMLKLLSISLVKLKKWRSNMNALKNSMGWHCCFCLFPIYFILFLLLYERILAIIEQLPRNAYRMMKKNK